jgi:hypothetical protein
VPDRYPETPLGIAEVLDIYAFEVFVIEVPIFARIRINILTFILKYIMQIYDFGRGC